MLAAPLFSFDAGCEATIYLFNISLMWKEKVCFSFVFQYQMFNLWFWAKALIYFLNISDGCGPKLISLIMHIYATFFSGLYERPLLLRVRLRQRVQTRFSM